MFVHLGHSDGVCLMPVLESIVIGHWSYDGQLHPEHINGTHGNIFRYEDRTDLKKQLVQLFSFDAQTVIDADPTNGLFNTIVVYVFCRKSQICEFTNLQVA